MVRIRLRRVGSKRQPSYRIMVANSRSPRDGRYIENVGFYNPRTEPATMEVNEERMLHWLSVGAQPSETVAYILKEVGTLDRFKRMKQGEDLAALVAEAEAASAERKVSPKASHQPTPRADKAPEAVAVEPQAEVVEPEAVEEVQESEAAEEVQEPEAVEEAEDVAEVEEAEDAAEAEDTEEAED
jgi:small subunit ribosomal protein S16